VFQGVLCNHVADKITTSPPALKLTVFLVNHQAMFCVGVVTSFTLFS